MESVVTRRLPRFRGRFVTLFGVGLATVLAYVTLLGWDQAKTLGSDGYLHGPYQPWQVVALVLVIGLVAAVAGLRRVPVSGSLTASLALVVCFSVDAATSRYNDGLWPIGAGIVLIASVAGTMVVAGAASAFSRDPVQESRRLSRSNVVEGVQTRVSRVVAWLNGP